MRAEVSGNMSNLEALCTVVDEARNVEEPHLGKSERRKAPAGTIEMSPYHNHGVPCFSLVVVFQTDEWYEEGDSKSRFLIGP